MDIIIQDIIPHPLDGIYRPDSDVWNKEVTFKQGDYYLIDAKSGKGKSTFIQLLYGIRRDFKGKLFLNGTDAFHFTKNELALLRQQEISILFQDLRLFLDLTALENIQLNCKLAHSPWAERIPEMAKSLQVSTLLNKKVGLLSYGERQRIALLRALVQPFKWILLDEPFSHLDKENAQACLALLIEIAESQDAGIILTSLGDETNYIPFLNHLYL